MISYGEVPSIGGRENSRRGMEVDHSKSACYQKGPVDRMVLARRMKLVKVETFTRRLEHSINPSEQLSY